MEALVTDTIMADDPSRARLALDVLGSLEVSAWTPGNRLPSLTARRRRLMADHPTRILDVMRSLEARDAADRVDGTPQAERLRAISPEVGAFLRLLVEATAARTIVEVGTSSGYSSLWLALGARRTGGH